MPTSTVEDYLKCIFLAEEERPDEPVATGSIATSLDVAPGTATAMVKTLAASGLVHYEPYTGVRLTESGSRLAAHVVRRHRLIESFLVKVMGFRWSEVHSDAEILEHAVSDRLLERIDDMLGRPSIDPHGDPIPTAGGEVRRHETIDLLGSAVGSRVEITRVIDQRAEFLELLERHGLMPGRTVRVEQRDDLAETLEVRPESGVRIRLGFRAASTILTTPVLTRETEPTGD